LIQAARREVLSELGEEYRVGEVHGDSDRPLAMLEEVPKGKEKIHPSRDHSQGIDVKPNDIFQDRLEKLGLGKHEPLPELEVALDEEHEECA